MGFRVMKLSSPVLVLLVLVLPLQAQSALAHFAGACGSSMAVASPDSRSEATVAGQVANAVGAGSTPEYAAGPSLNFSRIRPDGNDRFSSSSSEQPAASFTAQHPIPGTATDRPAENVKASSVVISQRHERADRNLDIYYRNRMEFSLDVGWHPLNVPFIFDFAVGDSYNRPPLNYTVVPIIASLRWHVTNVGWKWIFRGNMDFTFSGSITAIPRGPETRYYAFNFGIRRNFVYRNWKVVPYWEQRGGAGIIDAKEPLGVLFAQGQNLTFTYNMGAGVRYNLDSKYSFSASLNYMHISNAYLS